MKFGDVEAFEEKALADLKATSALHDEHCTPHPLGLRYPVSRPCPCGGAIAVCCQDCGDPVWVALDPRRSEPCECAVALYAEFGP